MRTTLIATGGTVAWHDEEQRMLSATELAAHAAVEVDSAVDLAPRPSSDLSIGDMAALASTVRGAIAEGAEVVVVLHGTDTMEESAWLTELLLGKRLRQAASVLFTGAMRFVDDPEADGPANLASAMAAGWLGPLEVGASSSLGEVSSTRRARCTRSTRPRPSPSRVRNGRLHRHRSPVRGLKKTWRSSRSAPLRVRPSLRASPASCLKVRARRTCRAPITQRSWRWSGVARP